MKHFSSSLEENEDYSDVESIKSKASPPNITWQHTWSFNETKNALTQSVFARIPSEIMLRIFKLFSVPDLCNVSLVCRRFKMIADQDEIWKLKCNSSKKIYSKSFKQIYLDWIYMKCLRNAKLRAMSDWFHSACDMILLPSYSCHIRPTDNQQFEAIGGFHQHPNSSSSMAIELSVDIEKTAPELIQLLEKASQFQQQWQQPSIVKHMITRYYRFMQLKASHPSNILLVPTFDIEIVWQTNLLRPAMYQADCLRLFRRVIDHSLLISDIEKFLKDQAFRDTCQLYEQQFGQQYCPLPSTDKKNDVASYSDHYQLNVDTDTNPTYSYWDKTHFEFSSEQPNDYENPFSFTEGDLITDGKWLDLCKQFMSRALKTAHLDGYHHIWSSGIDLQPGAINRLKKSYERFLYIAAKYPLKDGHEFIRPTYAIDIMWHSHMQEPLNYVADCVRIVGYVIYHSPWPINKDDTKNKTCIQANKLWKDEFKVDLMIDHLFNTIDDKLD
ncbi:unnamed protein product [Rotaria sp. Silwood1]|nr:unnamed protein product [Rotaria sp. Silwood1]CAF5103521.1 unnamed protein product [Rotaria sp. Silwood1]